jgi:hypothetical protein
VYGFFCTFLKPLQFPLFFAIVISSNHTKGFAMTADTQTNLWNAEEALARLGGNETLLNRIVGMYL